EFGDRIYRQILGFGEYGFPESHSVSFALLAYVSAWLKRHEPAAFLAALLNSQPMGFYTPSQLVQDARRHGVEVLPVDVTASEWECALEREAVRLGFLMVRGFSEAAAKRVVDTRREQAFDSVEDLAHRATLDRRDLKCLAAADALAPLAGHRREAHWSVAGVATGAHILAGAPVAESRPALSPPTEGESLVADYASTGLSLGRHPLALLRSRLARMRYATAEELKRLPSGARARAPGSAGARRGNRHRRPAPGHRLGNRLRDSRRRIRRRQRHRLAAPDRGSAARAAGLEADGSRRNAGARRRSDAPHREAPRRPQRPDPLAAGRITRFSLTPGAGVHLGAAERQRVRPPGLLAREDLVDVHPLVREAGWAAREVEPPDSVALCAGGGDRLVAVLLEAPRPLEAGARVMAPQR